MLYSFIQFMRLRECSGAVGWRDAVHASMSQWNVWIVTLLVLAFVFVVVDELELELLDMGSWEIIWLVLLMRK